MIEILAIIIVVLYPATLIYHFNAYNKKQSELLDRIMARNFSEYESYKQIEKKPKTPHYDNNFLQKSIRNAYREQKGPFDNEEALRRLEDE